jgi:hypothetical protein
MKIDRKASLKMLVKLTTYRSTEILDDGSIEWRNGPDLPIAITNSALVEDQSGGVILVGGLSNRGESLDTLFKLPHAGESQQSI